MNPLTCGARSAPVVGFCYFKARPLYAHSVLARSSNDDCNKTNGSDYRVRNYERGSDLPRDVMRLTAVVARGVDPAGNIVGTYDVAKGDFHGCVRNLARRDYNVRPAWSDGYVSFEYRFVRDRYRVLPRLERISRFRQVPVEGGCP